MTPDGSARIADSRRGLAALPQLGAPVVFFVDDLQWADPASLALLRRLFADPPHRMLVVGASREPIELGCPIVLGPLTVEDVAALLKERKDLAPLAHLCTGGNPFLLQRLLEKLARPHADAAALVREDASGFIAATLAEIPEATRLAPELEREAAQMRGLGQRVPLQCTEPFRALVSLLQGEAAAMPEPGAEMSLGALYVLQTLRLLERYLMRDLGKAIQIADEGEPYQDGAAVTYHQVVFRQTLALVCAELGQTDRARQNLAQLNAPAPHSHAHRLHLIEAELARSEGRFREAAELYDRSIEAARENGFLHEEALANELAGRFYLAEGRLTPARAYLMEARAAYSRWGATAKLRQLAEELPELVGRFGVGASNTETLEDVNLDLATLSEATLAISSEVQTSAGSRPTSCLSNWRPPDSRTWPGRPARPWARPTSPWRVVVRPCATRT